MDHVAPELHKDGFNCPHCNAYALMTWQALLSGNMHLSVWAAFCARCNAPSIWVDGDTLSRRLVFEPPGPVTQIYPAESTAPMHSDDLPEDCRADYREARTIVRFSPRGAAALLRLVIQKLCLHLGGSGEDINKDIGLMVENGLPKRVQEAMDTVRIVGNEAVHPGVLNLNDDPVIVDSLFKLVNLIVERMLTEPRQENDLYRSLPPKKLKGIEQRDK